MSNPPSGSGETESFRWLLDNSPDGIAISRDGETIYVNHRMGEIFGDTVENIMKASNFAYLHPDSLELVRTRIRARLAGEQVPPRYEIRVQRKDGAIRFVETNATRIIWDGEPAVLSINRDITNMRSLEAKFEALLKHVADMNVAETIEEIAVITKETVNQTIGFNRLSIGLVIGDNLVHRYRWGINSEGDFVMPLNGPGITVQVVNNKQTMNIGNISEVSGYVDGVGNLSTRSELAVPIIIEDEAIGVLNLESEQKFAFSDHDQRLTEALAEQVASALARIRAQQTGKELRATLNAFMDTASESFVLFDKDLVFLEVNEIGAQRIGYKPEELIGRKMIDVMPEIAGTERYKKYLEVIKTGKSQTVDAVHHLSGIDHLRINAFKVGDGLGLIASDLSELYREQENRRQLDRELVEARLRTEQLIELNRLKTNFMNTATHEIRTPITSVRGYSEIILSLLAEGDVEKIKPHFQAVIRNIDRLELLSRDLLDMQRIESGRMTVNKKEVLVDDMINQLESEMTPILMDKDQNLVIDNNSNGKTARIDELRILQVLINLVNNASKYSDYGKEITLTVDETPNSVRFIVTDKGIGLSKEDLSKLFTPFPDIRVRRVSHGSGLGLSISKGIIDLHGGSITAESEGIGAGAKFTVLIPK